MAVGTKEPSEGTPTAAPSGPRNLGWDLREIAHIRVLSAVAIILLTTGAGVISASLRVSEGQRIYVVFGVIVAVVLIVALDVVFESFLDPQSLANISFTVNISRKKGKITVGCPRVVLILKAPGCPDQEVETDEMGNATFRVNLARARDVRLTVRDPETNQGYQTPLYQHGHFYAIKTIYL